MPITSLIALFWVSMVICMRYDAVFPFFIWMAIATVVGVWWSRQVPEHEYQQLDMSE